VIFGWQFFSWIDTSQKNANKNNETTLKQLLENDLIFIHQKVQNVQWVTVENV